MNQTPGKYIIHPDFKVLAKIHPPLNRKTALLHTDGCWNMRKVH